MKHTGHVATIGKFQIFNLVQDWFALDAGVLFGNIPKSVWKNLPGLKDIWNSRNNLVSLPINTFLIVSPTRRILVDTSCGDMNRWGDKTIKQFRMRQTQTFAQALIPYDLVPGDIDCVIHTHLHFDHAGGDVRKDSDGNLVPTFPRARYIVCKEEIEHALSAHPKTRSSYRRETVAGIELLLEQKKLVGFSALKFLLHWEIQMEPGITLVFTPGHTQSHYSVLIESEGKTAFIAGALLTTRWHTHPAFSIGNDTSPFVGSDIKTEYLRQANEENWLVLLEHDELVAGRLEKTPDGQFHLMEA